MVVYSCRCLNIQLFAEAPTHLLDPENLASCPLGSDIELVELIDQGFQCSQKCLVHRSKSGPWMVHVCVLCKTPTHAVDQDAHIVAVSTSMMKGKSAIDNLRQKEDFSTVFGLLLNQYEDNEQEVEGQSYDTIQKQLLELQTVLSGFLRREEDAMEQRIRKYEEDQREKFDRLRDVCVREKAKLNSLLFTSLDGQQQTNQSAAPKEQTEILRNPGRSHAPLGQSKSIDVANMTPEKRNSRPLSGSSARRSRDSRDMSPDEKRYSRPLSGSSSRRSRDSRDMTPDDMFSMDEFDEALDLENDNSPRTGNNARQGRSAGQNSNSSLDHRLRQEQDRNNSNYPQGSSSRSRSRGKDGILGIEGSSNAAAQRSVLSSSLPISMPMGARNLRASSNLDDDIDEESTDFDDIPRHMQALSESIQERDRYIFGDRPRQRVNTGDFTQINWR